MPKLLLFSDLHVNPQSEHTCFEVLEAVLNHAHRIDATVCFLGDWWDHVYRNGTLQTDMQNRFIRFFSSKWDVPTLMIPGNHDYCDASEREHALTAFQYACPQITIFEVPTVHQNILWIPWRRKHEDLIKALNSGGDIKCIFGHFDIVGALLNNTRVSDEGLRPAEFPPGLPIYSGHYHKPQKHEQVVFVGSPYQTTQAECGQQKRLLILDTESDYKEFVEIPINFGPSRFKVSNVEDIPDTIAQRDIVTVKLASGEPVPDKIVDLRRKGVIVKIKRVAEARPVRFEMKPDTRPEELLDAYAKGREDPEVIDFIKGELKKIQTDMQTELFGAIEWHELSGVIGPFTKPFHIDLNGRGLVLVTGQRDEERSRSNGSGKSFCTCTAMLWVLTGITDTRSGGDSSKDQKRPAVASVVNEKVGRAHVVLKGKVGEKNIEVERKYIFSKKTNGKGYQKLTVKANGQNITRATLDATQHMLCQIMGVPSGGAKRASHALHAWLIRTALWTQSAPTSWLKMSDKYIKDELSWLAAVDMWDKVLEVVKEEIGKSKDMFVRIDASIKHARLDISTFKAQLERMKRSNEVFQEKKQAKITDLERKIEALPNTAFEAQVFDDPPPLNIERPELNTATYKYKTEDLWKSKADLQTAKNLFHSVPHPIVVPKVEYVDLENFKKKVNELQARAIPPETECKACGRPFMGDEEKCKAVERYKNIMKRLRKAERDLLAAAERESEMKVKTKEAEVAKQALLAEKEIHKLEPYIEQLEKEIAVLQKKHEIASEEYVKAYEDHNEKKMAVHRLRCEQEKRRTEHENNKKERERLERELRTAKQERSPFFLEIQQNENKIERAERQLKDFCERTADLRKKAEMLRRAKDWVGTKGVRTYVMDNTLRMLEKSMVKWASIMFPDEDIHVRLDHRDDGTIERIVQVSNINTTLSGGQFRRMEIASWFSWREAAINRSGITQNVVFMDEPTHSLDLKGVECLTDGLKQFCRELHNRSIMFITHENTQFRDTSSYDNMLHVVRKGPASHLRKHNMKRKCNH